MNHAPLLFLGIFFSFALSWWGMVLAPQLQVGRQEPVQAGGTLYPLPRSGLAEQGHQLYRSLGCIECHTQQVRDSDVPVWGPRITVAQDYLRDYPVLPGNQRVGPDLANIGLRKPDAAWHLLHLYDPQITSPKSSMPPYRFLFHSQKIRGTASPAALKLPEKFAPEAGYEVVPSRDAEALVAYLLGLRHDVPLYEAPMPEEKPKAGQAPEGDKAASPEDAATGGTNAPAP